MTTDSYSEKSTAHQVFMRKAVESARKTFMTALSNKEEIPQEIFKATEKNLRESGVEITDDLPMGRKNSKAQELWHKVHVNLITMKQISKFFEQVVKNPSSPKQMQFTMAYGYHRAVSDHYHDYQAVNEEEQETPREQLEVLSALKNNQQCYKNAICDSKPEIPQPYHNGSEEVKPTQHIEAMDAAVKTMLKAVRVNTVLWKTILKEKKKKLETMKKEVGQLKKKNSNLEEEVKHLQDDLHNLETKAEEMEKWGEENATLKKKIEELQSKKKSFDRCVIS